MKRIFTISILTVLFNSHFFASTAQQRDCGTVPFDSVRRSLNPVLPSAEDFETWLSKNIHRNQGSGLRRSKTTQIIYRIPVVVHVVHNGEAAGEGANIPYEQVQSQIEVLNEDFRKSDGSNGYNDDPNGADTEIEFYLAETDPTGMLMTEPGVHRVNGGRSDWPKGPIQNPIETSLKPSTIWDPTRYFNIWTVNFGGFFGRNLLGYAQFPEMSGLDGLADENGIAETDGVVIGYPYFGSRQKGDFNLYAPFDLGRTATHEVGHWLGLRHIWGDSDDCAADDYCNDTPIAAGANYGCPTGKVSCGSEDMIRNYLDYTDDACMNIFTYGQKERMLTVLQNSPRRSEIVNIITVIPEEVSTKEELVLQLDNGSLIITLPEGDQIACWKIIDAIGRLVYRSGQPASNNSSTVDISNLKSGLYLTQVSSSKDQHYTGRIILD